MGQNPLIPREQSSSPSYFFILSIILIFVAELLVMFILPVFPELSFYKEALLDSLLLSLIIIPLLYILLFRPMAANISVRMKAQEQLRTINNNLEEIIDKSTRELSNEIKERKLIEEELKKSATTDKLTQAYNRVKYDEIIENEIERSERYEQLLSVILFDIDNFKGVNDNHGHNVGDSVLVALTDVVKKNKRSVDCLIRWGGEEFLIVAPGIDLEGAKVLTERVRQAIEKFKFDGVGDITVSLGVTQFEKGDTEDTLIKRADDALYKAKMAGKNQFMVGAGA
jgi:diguanylate cyclase (GGDEF)-like protein